MKFKWNLPNLLTILRVLLIPLIIYMLIIESTLSVFIALLLYFVSIISDYFDGKIARKYNQKSEFGEYFDPLADKFLIWAIFTLFSFKVGLFIPIWLIAFIYLRDLLVTCLRSVSKIKKLQFKTSVRAKAKTFVQMTGGFIILLYMFITVLIRDFYKVRALNYYEVWNKIMPGHSYMIVYIPLIISILVVIFTIYTGIDYLIKFKKGKTNEE